VPFHLSFKHTGLIISSERLPGVLAASKSHSFFNFFLSFLVEQHSQCRTTWQAPGSHPAILEGRRKIPERHATPW
jgi:hypothetical protein